MLKATSKNKPTLLGNMTKKGEKSDCKDGKPKKANESANDQTVTPLIFKIKPVYPSKCKVKVTFKDKDGDMVKE